MKVRKISGKRLAAVMAAIGLTAAAAACGSNASTSSPATSSKQQTTFSYLTDYIANGVYTPMWYGKQLGYYAQEGINLQVEYGTGSSTTAEAVASGKADVGDVFSGVLMEADARGANLESVGLFRADGGFAFFCDNKLHVNSIAQLKGRSVIIPPGTVQAELYPGALKAAGLPANSIKPLSVSSADAGADYARGQGDCIIETTGDAPTFQSLRPSTTILWSSVGFNVPGFAFVATKSFINGHKALVRGFLTATYKSIAASLAHPAAAEAAFVAANPRLGASLADKQWQVSLQGFCTAAMTSQHVPIGYQIPAVLNSGVQIIRKYQGLSQSVTPGMLYTDDFFTLDHVSSTNCGAGAS